MTNLASDADLLQNGRRALRSQSIIYDMVVRSDIELPVVFCPSKRISREAHQFSPVHIRFKPGTLSEFKTAFLVASVAQNQIRAYEVSSGLLLYFPAAKLRILIEKLGRAIVLDFDLDDPIAYGVAQSVSVNLALSVSALLQARIPLHAASIAIDGNVIGLLAPSGTGKSTLLTRLLEQGSTFVTDDVLVVHDAGDWIKCFPSRTLYAKLDADMAQRRTLDAHELIELVPSSEEYWLPLPASERIIDPCRLNCLFYLKPKVSASTPSYLKVRQATAAESLNVLMHTTQGLHVAYTLLPGKKILCALEKLARLVPVFILEYARNLHNLPPLVRLIRETSQTYATRVDSR